ncbi:hypothetical protein HC891_27395 [Candidatus Gracilibacteria bacterium]|nr:hypothetical protein [Candidatus Gracilibacteria bacterium]
MRYSPFIVVVSACKNPTLGSVSNDARWVLYTEQLRDNKRRFIRVDMLTTRENTPPIDQHLILGSEILNDQEVLLRLNPSWVNEKYAIWNTSSNQVTRITVQSSGGELLSESTLDALAAADTVIIAGTTITAVYRDGQNYTQQSFAIDTNHWSWLPPVREQLDQANIAYHYEAPPPGRELLSDELSSRSGTLLATPAGIIDTQTQAVLVSLPPGLRDDEPPWLPQVWIANDEAVLYTRGHTTVGGLGMWAAVAEGLLVVPQPLLVLRVP